MASGLLAGAVEGRSRQFGLNLELEGSVVVKILMGVGKLYEI
jgi:hypothetical protein